jgi:hypothetical protein
VSLQGINIAGRPARVSRLVLWKAYFTVAEKSTSLYLTIRKQLSWGKDRTATNATANSNPNAFQYPAPAPYMTQMPAASPVWLESNGQQPGLQPWMGVYYPAYQPHFNAAQVNKPIEDTA